MFTLIRLLFEVSDRSVAFNYYGGKIKVISYVCFSTSDFSVDLKEYMAVLQVAGSKNYRRGLEID